MDDALAVAAVLLSAGAPSLVPAVADGPAGRVSRSLGLSASAGCALAAAANTKQTETTTARLPDFMLRPRHADFGDRAVWPARELQVRIMNNCRLVATPSAHRLSSTGRPTRHRAAPSPS